MCYDETNAGRHEGRLDIRRDAGGREVGVRNSGGCDAGGWEGGMQGDALK